MPHFFASSRRFPALPGSLPRIYMHTGVSHVSYIELQLSFIDCFTLFDLAHSRLFKVIIYLICQPR